jgi:hypothetical protein
MVSPLKNKTVKEVVNSITKMFDERQPQSICTDRGKEWSGAFQDMLKRRGVRHFYAQGSTHCAVVERFIRTLRGKIARYRYKNNTDRYIDFLQRLVHDYNHTFHSSIKMRPVDVNKDNDHLALDNLRSKRKIVKKKPFEYKVGDLVRMSGAKHPFRREFFQRWSEEVFNVKRRYNRDNINMYKLADCSGEEILGSFYAKELKNAYYTDDMYRIEKVLDEKTVNGVKYAKVKWEYYPTKCAEWILKSTIKNVK